jgi:spore maturation protein SpmB
MSRFWKQVKSAGVKTIKPALLTIRFLLIIMIPVSLVVLLLDASGILFYVSRFMRPLMRFIGLSGEASLVFISSVFLNIYSAIAVIHTLSLSAGEIVILATMCCVAHNFFVECLVAKKTGSSLLEMIFLRLGCALIAGWILHLFIPTEASVITAAAPRLGMDWQALPAQLFTWVIDTGQLILKIILIIFAVMFLQKLLDELGIMRLLGRITAPLMRFMGLPVKCAYVWIVAELVGLTYGSGVLIEEVQSGAITRKEADLFNHHATMNHAQIEDTILFVSLGVPYLWVAVPRFILAIIVVWIRRWIANFSFFSSFSSFFLFFFFFLMEKDHKTH